MMTAWSWGTCTNESSFTAEGRKDNVTRYMSQNNLATDCEALVSDARDRVYGHYFAIH